MKERLDTRLCQIYEQVLPGIRDVFVDLKHVSASCKFVYMYNVLHYTSYAIVWKERNTSRLCHSKAVSPCQNPTTFIAKI